MITSTNRHRGLSTDRRGAAAHGQDHQCGRTDNLAADPLAAGFEAIAMGYSLRYSDDLENIER